MSKFNKSLKNRYSNKINKKSKIQEKSNNNLTQQLNMPINSKQYKRGVRSIALKQTCKNFFAFGKWCLINLLWLLLPYISYGWFQTLLTDTLLTNKISSKDLWGVQQQLTMNIAITAALVVIAGIGIIKHGKFQKKYNKQTLKQEINAKSKNLNKDN